ncbi:hypothetical protein FKM82_002088 [Ascaphus truei]
MEERVSSVIATSQVVGLPGLVDMEDVVRPDVFTLRFQGSQQALSQIHDPKQRRASEPEMLQLRWRPLWTENIRSQEPGF